MGSYFAIGLFPKAHNEGEGCYIRSLKVNGFKSKESALNAIKRANIAGYVKKLGQVQPVAWVEI